MLGKLLALSSIGAASAAAGSIAALCDALTAAPCLNYNFQGMNPAPTSAQCQMQFNLYGWAAGDDTVGSGNNIGCRQFYANLAVSSNTSGYCQYAGVTGGGRCGTVISNACDHINATCLASPVAPFASPAACAAALKAANWGSKQGTAASAEDSLECRVYHTTAAYGFGGSSQATLDLHCPHALATSTQCTGAISVNNWHHCDTIQNACTGSKQQYNSVADCLAAVPSFPNTLNDARDTNTANDQGCRQYHAQAAASGAGDIHCTHGGPSGQNVCGGGNGTRDSWNFIANNAACQAVGNLSVFGQAVKLAFQTWKRDDIIAVMPTSTNNYTVAATGDNDFCRIYHCTVASLGTPSALTHCEHCSIQSSQCFDGTNAPGFNAVCRMALAGCPGNFADVATCVAALAPLAATKLGDVTALTPAAADTFACRAYQAGVALSSKGMSQTAAQTAACLNVKVAAGPACGGTTTTPKSDAASLVVSAAIVLPFLM
jgi:hypothetical protein